MKRTTAREARAIMCEEITRFGENSEPGATPKHSLLTEGRTLDWWLSAPDNGPVMTGRTKAFLSAYVKISVTTELLAEGLQLDRHRIHMDRWVMGQLHRHGYVTFHEDQNPFFAVTSLGEKLIQG